MFSYTMYNSYNHCPLLYKRKYIEKKGKNGGYCNKTVYGSLIHKVMNSKDKELNFLYQKDIEGVDIKLEKDDLTTIIEEPKEKAKSTLNMEERIALRAIHFDGTVCKLVYREQLITYKISDTITLLGIVDYMELTKKNIKYNKETNKIKADVSDCLILDWKTGGTELTKDQLSFYAMIIFNRILNLKKIRLAIGMVEKEEDYLHISFKDTKEIKRIDIVSVEKKIIQTIYKALEDKEYKATPGIMCKYCSFKCNKGHSYLGY